jgi:nuclease S1
MKRRWFVVGVLAMLVTLHSATPAWAWGRLGHRVISRLAKKHMTEKARDALAELLGPGETIADASTWADEYRRENRKTAPWHYVDVPLDEPKYDAKWSADDPKMGCVVEKINEFGATLKEPNKTVDERRLPLQFRIPCIADPHMPMRVGADHDRGGNDIRVRTLEHSLRTSGTIERLRSKRDRKMPKTGGEPAPHVRGTRT